MLARTHPEPKEAARYQFQNPNALNDHLYNTLTTQSLAANKLLVPQTSEGVEECGNNENNGHRDQAGSTRAETGPLDGAEDCVHGSSHPVCSEAADEGIECGGRRANAEEPGNFNEEDDKGRGAVAWLMRMSSAWEAIPDLQGKDGKDDPDDVNSENVGNPKRQAKNHTQNTGPSRVLSASALLHTGGGSEAAVKVSTKGL
jgi:hypothetical protein